jgi:SAM-dependent methyltransferase
MYYQPDLAWIHHVGYSQYAEQAAAGIVRSLLEAGLAAGASVADIGCGSGLLARRLHAAGFEVRGFDASPAMIELARKHAPGARFEVRGLPTGAPAGSDTGLPPSDAVVSTGHVLNYLDSRADLARALGELALAVRPGGLLLIDLMTERFCDRPGRGDVHAKVDDDWAIVTRYSRPGPHRFDRAITVFRREGDAWRRSDEHHRNVTFDADEALGILRSSGLDAEVRASFGDETLPEGLVVLSGARSAGPESG